ncbi:hypothetical protein BCR42DRAFT_455235 [Absidia repens]|uniref:F-BAR domain-containing protein n=1 Tax=Absidia repens TaxID=90262 RepID=A0A1X2I475_9FUNG|nr:hypothetical protein BCR42DRAFT_455235 [Absidia repens]
MTRNYTFSGYFWEHQNHNGVVTLVDRMRMGKQTCEKLKAAYEIRVLSEENHADALFQMASNLQTCNESGQLGQVLNTTQEQWTLLANAHVQTAKDLNSAVILPLATLLTKQKQLRRQLQANVTKFYNNRQLQTHCVLRARDRYNAECTKANEIMQQSSGKEKHLTYKRANAVIKKFQQAYDDSMADLKMVTEEWNKQWQNTCQEFELLEEERLSFLQSNIYTCNDVLSGTLNGSAEAYEKIGNAVDLMDVDADLDDFVQKNGGVTTIPDAMDYIKLYVLHETTKSQDNDDSQLEAATTTDSVPHKSALINNEPYPKMESKENVTTDMTDTTDNTASLMVGRMEMYNSDDDDYTDSDYDDDGDDYSDGNNDHGDKNDAPSDNTTDHPQCDESNDYHNDIGAYQQDDNSENYTGMANERLHDQHLKYYYDHDHPSNDLTHHLNETSDAATSGYTGADDEYQLTDSEGREPLEGLGIEATDDKLHWGNLDNGLESYSEEHIDKQLNQQHRNSRSNYSEYFDDGSNADNILIPSERPEDGSTMGISQVTRVTGPRSPTEPRQQRSIDTEINNAPKGSTIEQKPRRQPPSINTHYLENDSYHSSAAHYNVRREQQPAPPVPQHHNTSKLPADLPEDTDAMISTPASPSSMRVNEELDDMLRQLEQQTLTKPDKSALGSRSLTKKKQPSSGRVRLSGVRPRAPKPKPGQKLLKELAGIDATLGGSNGKGDGKNTPLDEWPLHASPSSSLTSHKDFFDPFSSLATMSSNSLSIARSAPSAAQAQRQQQKQEKWMLDEVTQVMRQNNDNNVNNIKRRPLPDRPMNSTILQAENNIKS